MLLKTRGIVFKTRKYSESSVIADIFTEEKGLRSYIISGVRTQKAKVSAGLLQPMSIVEFVAYHRDDKDLSRLKEIKAHRVYRSIPFEVKRGAVGIFMVEVARNIIQGHEAWPELFEFLLDNFTHLDESPHFSNIHLHYLLRLSGFLGFQPGGTFNSETPFFDLQEGLFVEREPSHLFWLKPELGNLLHQFIQNPLQDCHSIKIGRLERRALLGSLLDYFRLHIEQFPAIHSHLILEEVLS